MTKDTSIDPRHMRNVMGSFCTGVTVITAHDGERPVGFACQSLSSVSLEPPLVSFCPARTSSSWPLIRDIGILAINVLAADQLELCQKLAVSGGDKFSTVPWTAGANGAPVIEGAIAQIEAFVVAEHDAGDHTIVVAQVTSLNATTHDGEPLLFYRGQFGNYVTRMSPERTSPRGDCSDASSVGVGCVGPALRPATRLEPRGDASALGCRGFHNIRTIFQQLVAHVTWRSICRVCHLGSLA